jgi:hypothetical protein
VVYILSSNCDIYDLVIFFVTNDLLIVNGAFIYFIEYHVFLLLISTAELNMWSQELYRMIYAQWFY